MISWVFSNLNENKQTYIQTNKQTKKKQTTKQTNKINKTEDSSWTWQAGVTQSHKTFLGLFMPWTNCGIRKGYWWDFNPETGWVRCHNTEQWKTKSFAASSWSLLAWQKRNRELHGRIPPCVVVLGELSAAQETPSMAWWASTAAQHTYPLIIKLVQKAGG